MDFNISEAARRIRSATKNCTTQTLSNCPFIMNAGHIDRFLKNPTTQTHAPAVEATRQLMFHLGETDKIALANPEAVLNKVQQIHIEEAHGPVDLGHRCMPGQTDELCRDGMSIFDFPPNHHQPQNGCPHCGNQNCPFAPQNNTIDHIHLIIHFIIIHREAILRTPPQNEFQNQIHILFFHIHNTPNNLPLPIEALQAMHFVMHFLHTNHGFPLACENNVHPPEVILIKACDMLRGQLIPHSFSPEMCPNCGDRLVFGQCIKCGTAFNSTVRVDPFCP